ncbi:hypothetical protein, partial [Sporolactobacillus spathodeae]|uniref:hypothetical protein n=1 Tax=Sporolactobacillus spathodeae TaxID=1465502 RepID=UPI0039EB8008
GFGLTFARFGLTIRGFGLTPDLRSNSSRFRSNYSWVPFTKILTQFIWVKLKRAHGFCVRVVKDLRVPAT